MLIAHRGLYGDGVVENTILAFDKAFEMKMDGIELDVRLTLDNIPVVIHDSFISRVSNGRGLVNNMLYKDLLKYNFGGKYPSKILKLSDVISRYDNKIIFIELKDNIDLSNVLNNKNVYYISSFDKDIIYNLKKGNYKVGVINYIFNRNIDYSKTDFVMILNSFITDNIIEYYSNKNIEVVSYGNHGKVSGKVWKNVKYII